MSTPVTLEFNEGGGLYAWIDLAEHFKKLPNPQEYFIAPSAHYDGETKIWEVDGYSFVHVSHLPTEEQFREKMKGVTG